MEAFRGAFMSLAESFTRGMIIHIKIIRGESNGSDRPYLVVIGGKRNGDIAGGLAGKLVLYPIAPAKDGKQLMNWVVNVRIADPSVQPPPPESWSKMAPLSRVLPYAKRFQVPGMDIEALVRSSGAIFEYPMADRDPLPRWTHGRVTLLGDAAHPMYPVGSNGSAQAILDARCLADQLAQSEHPREALYRYEEDRLPKTAEVVRTNRIGGPERVIDEVEKRSPAGFEDIDQVLSFADREAIVKGYAKMAGFAARASEDRAAG